MTGSPFLALPGAVAAEGVDAGVAGHYGNPIVEQRKLERGDAIVDLSDRGVVTVTGPDRLSWLHSMASQALSRLRPGTGTEALLLDASGRIEHAAHVIDDGETTWLVVEGDEAAEVGAIARLGAKQDGILRNHQLGVNGTLRDTVVFSILPAEWPVVKTHLRHRLNLAEGQAA